MRVLVAVGSKYGATREIAQTVAKTLEARGFDVSCEDAKDIIDVDGYDAYVIGSAVYGGFWRRDASSLVRTYAETLEKSPVWLFSSGPVGLPPKPAETQGEGTTFAAELKAKDHRVFSGFLNPDKLNAGERALVRGLRASVGDYRQWGEIREWADEVADGVATLSASLNDRPTAPA